MNVTGIAENGMRDAIYLLSWSWPDSSEYHTKVRLSKSLLDIVLNVLANLPNNLSIRNIKSTKIISDGDCHTQSSLLFEWSTFAVQESGDGNYISLSDAILNEMNEGGEGERRERFEDAYATQ
tara:strand:+ start:1615 stop:1983 length:369 start_codon:yes stop_codon:yes gene_type:complete